MSWFHFESKEQVCKMKNAHPRRDLNFLTSIITCMICFSMPAMGQQLAIDRSEIASGKIILHYSIQDTVSQRFYTVRAYSSKDNFLHPLALVDGDAGIGLRPGKDKKLVWDPKELGENFDGKVAIELRAVLYVPFVHMEGFHEYRTVKRLKPYSLTWSGGTPQNVLNIEVYRRKEKVTVFPNIANVGHYNIELPKHIRPGKHYSLKISDSKNKDEVVFSDEFKVRRKYPLALKILSVLAVAGATYFLLDGDQGPAPLPMPVLPE
jgi:hypothetical protein